MKNYESLEDALSDLQKPVKRLPDADATVSKKRKSFSGNIESNPLKKELKGKEFFFNNVEYTVKSVTADDLVTTKQGTDFKLETLINNGVKFTEPKKSVNYIKASTNTSGEYDSSNEEEADNYAFVSDEESEKDIKTGSTTIKARLERDSKAIKNIYVKKVPDYKTLETQIQLTTEERENYLLAGNKEAASKCTQLIETLKLKKKDIDKAFGLKSYTAEDRRETEEKMKTYKKNPEYVAIEEKLKKLREEHKRHSASAIMTNLSDLRKNKKVTENLTFNDTFSSLESVLGDTSGSKSLHEVDQELYEHCQLIADILNKHIQDATLIHTETLNSIANKSEDELNPQEKEYLSNTSEVPGLDEEFTDYMHFTAGLIESLPPNNVRKLLKLALDDKYKALKSDIEITQNEMRFKRNELMQGEQSIGNYLLEMFDFSSEDDNDSVQSKEVLAAVNTEFATRIAYKEAMSLGSLHNLDEAISGAMMGLSVALETWYQTQKSIPTTPADFQSLLYISCRSNVRKALQDLVSTQVTGTNHATIVHKQKKLLDAAIRNNPQLANIPPELAKTLVFGAADVKAFDAYETSETVLAGVIGGSEEEGVDVWSKIGGEDDIDMVEAQNYYRRVINSITALFDEFEVGEDKQGNVYTKTNKMFDVYDRIILLSKFGFTFDSMEADPTVSILGKRKNKSIDTQSGVVLEASNEEIATYCEIYARDVMNDSNKTFTSNAISTRYLKIMNTKLPLLMQHKPEIEEGLRYMLLWIKTNPEAMAKMSAFREEKTLIKTREQLIEIYSDQLEEVGNTKMIDGRSLIDTYQASQQNTLGDDIGEMFNEFMV